MVKVIPPPISGSGMIRFGKEKQSKLLKKGYRTVLCPACGKAYTAKNIVEVVACSACNYRKAI